MLPGMTSEPEQQIGVGTPDAFQRLWTPHRMAYIQGENKPEHGDAGDDCPFCAAPKRSDEDGLIVATRCDPVVFRAFVRMFNMLEPPEVAFGRREVIWRSLRVWMRGKRRNQIYAVPAPPDRETTIARCEAAAA